MACSTAAFLYRRAQFYTTTPTLCLPVPLNLLAPMQVLDGIKRQSLGVQEDDFPPAEKVAKLFVHWHEQTRTKCIPCLHLCTPTLLGTTPVIRLC